MNTLLKLAPPELLEHVSQQWPANLTWDNAHTAEILNFLLNEFLSNGFQEREWDKKFVADVVFETTRVIDLLNKLNHLPRPLTPESS